MSIAVNSNSTIRSILGKRPYLRLGLNIHSATPLGIFFMDTFRSIAKQPPLKPSS